MNPSKRPVPFPPGSEARARAIRAFMWDGRGYRAALSKVAEANRRVRAMPIRGEKCEAKTRNGTPCQCKPLANGRCKLHGGKSTGPKTEEGRKRSAANLRRG